VYKHGRHRSDAEQRIAKVPIIMVDGDSAVCTGGEKHILHCFINALGCLHDNTVDCSITALIVAQQALVLQSHTELKAIAQLLSSCG
jgi:hypothetical protein